MNVEFQIHGVLDNGQSFWKQDDKDYYQTFYSPQTKNSLMTVEVLRRPQGICTYYNYLRYNNVVSAREGSYFGMSVRIDGEYCVDVRGMYDILDNLFEKKIIGKILIPTDNGKLKYEVDSFENIDNFLSEVESNFSMMFSAFFGPGDFVAVSVPSQNKSYQLNPIDITQDLVHEALSKNLKITLSPEILPQIARDIEKRADDRIRNAKAELELERRTLNDNADRTGTELAALRKEAKALKQENAQLKSQAQLYGKNDEILESMQRLRQQMASTSEIIRTHMPETASPVCDTEANAAPAEKRKENDPVIISKKTLLLILATAISVWVLFQLFSRCSQPVVNPEPSPIENGADSTAAGSIKSAQDSVGVADPIRNILLSQLPEASIDIDPTPGRNHNQNVLLSLNTNYKLGVRKNDRQLIDLHGNGQWTVRTVNGDTLSLHYYQYISAPYLTITDSSLVGQTVTVSYTLDNQTISRQLIIKQ